MHGQKRNRAVVKRMHDNTRRSNETVRCALGYLLHHEAGKVHFGVGGVEHGDGELRGFGGAGRALQHRAHSAGGAVAAVGDDAAHDTGARHVPLRDVAVVVVIVANQRKEGRRQRMKKSSEQKTDRQTRKKLGINSRRRIGACTKAKFSHRERARCTLGVSSLSLFLSTPLI